jgi:polysaccharide export outer membrane protein
MKNNTSFNCGLLFPKGILCALALAVFAGVSGCASHKDAPRPGAAAVPVAAAPDETAHRELIILREGDTVRISFPGNSNLDTAQQIRRDGRITMPLVGEVDASGLTPDQLKDKMIKLYEAQIASKEVTVTVVSSSFPVFVTGAVVHPGKILSDHPITALEAIMEAGGFDLNTANLKDVQVIRQETNTTEHFQLNLKAVMKGTDTHQFFLKPSDIIYVPERFSFF